MAENNAVLTSNDFSDDEWELLERAAKGKAPSEWLRAVALELAETIVASDGDGPEPDDDDMPLEGAQESVDGGKDDDSLVMAGGIDALILERLARLERMIAEVCVWAETVLSELYAHTGFATPEAERVARAKAIEKFAKIRASVEATMAKGNGTAH